jgi:endonuclease YncB( thermonuclease family)
MRYFLPLLLLAGLPPPALADDLYVPNLRKCHEGERNTTTKTCVVDGDTVWLKGNNLRLQSFDTPEPMTQICGGEAEVALAHQASDRLLQLLNDSRWTVETFGVDGTGDRILATIRIDGRDVGDILIEEGLARRWPDGDEWWCQF